MFNNIKFLVVEDDYFVAEEILAVLRGSGADVVGPFARVQPALEAIERVTLAGAVLDFRLDGETTENLAKLLLARNVPVLLATGYERDQLPPALQRLPRLRKPFGVGELLKTLASELGIAPQHPPVAADEHDVPSRRNT